MRNYVAVVFNDTSKAYEGLHALWQLDSDGEITVHGTAVVHRDELGPVPGRYQGDAPRLGYRRWRRHWRLAWRFGGTGGRERAAGAAAGGAAIGAATGGMVGLAADAGRADTRAPSGRRDAVRSWRWPICRYRRRERRLDVADRYADAQSWRNCLSARQERCKGRSVVRRVRTQLLSLPLRLHAAHLPDMIVSLVDVPE